MIHTLPWERRLDDLAHILESCGSSYFDPDRFRRNTNQFLQTSRTITFIIQKKKSEIPDFENWYSVNVVEPWRDDELMKWAKDARNKVEKQGDLDINSELKVTLFFSYLSEEDVSIDCGIDELLNAGVKKLIRFAQKSLPSAISDAAAVKIERKWVTEKIESYELLYALGYVYSRVYDCCYKLAKHLGRSFPEKLLSPSDVSSLHQDSRKVQMVKMSDLKTYSISYYPRKIRRNEVPDKIKDIFKGQRLVAPHDFDSLVEYYKSMAILTFNHWKYHQSMTFLIAEDWSVQDMISPVYEDQVDKYFFWRLIEEKVRSQNTYCVLTISEAWLRQIVNNQHLPIRKMPIKGEFLQLMAFDRENHRASLHWPIERATPDSEPTLGPERIDDMDHAPPYILIPAMRGMDIEPSFSPKPRSRRR
ncbi:hypothetical protein [Marinobacter halotolerans]|uniref:hypothetical protein n=1 Tax=Marinobacter halotolerans TaxID=1569211 RepID=UPI0012471D7F|nr:hypothetical protein [Marinobacter halotolerans]